MAGTLTISTLSDGTNSTSSTNCIQGSAKAWVNYDTVTTTTLRSSYNVSSLTDNGTGDTTINFTNAMPNVNYAIAAGTGYESATSGTGIYRVSAKTTTSVRVVTTNGSGTAQDQNGMSFTIFSL